MSYISFENVSIRLDFNLYYIRLSVPVRTNDFFPMIFNNCISICDSSPRGSGWIIGVGQVGQVIHPLLRGVAIVWDRKPRLPFPTNCTFFIIHSSLITLLPLFLCFISFLLFPCTSVGKTLMREFYISYSHAEWNLAL